MRRAAGLGIVLFLASAAAPATAMLRVGEDVPRVVETAHPYAGPGPRERAELVRADTLHHSGATYVAVHFSRFELAPGDHVVVRSPDGAQAWRYEGLGRAGLGLHADGFWATHVKGDTAIVELYSARELGTYGYRIDRYARGFTQAEIAEKNPGEIPYDPEAICGADDSQWAACFPGVEPQIYDHSRAVARLLINGAFSCTGWLVGCEGHLMTNNHCISSSGEALNTDYEFMAEGATCATNCAGSFACPGTIAATSATLVQTNVPLDYTLVKLPTNVTPTYGFLTLRESGAVLNERIYVPQHPAGWGKRIAVASTNSNDQSGFAEIFSLNTSPCTGGPGDIGYFADTQGGSSGSPVLAYSDHKVVSLHHCANCPNRGLDIVDVIGNLGPNLPACAVAQTVGTVELNKTVYTAFDAVGIEVKDDSIAGQGTQAVTAKSTTESVAETVTLVEDGPSSGNFVGAIQLDEDASPVHGDGLLGVLDDDTVTVEYIDASDGLGGTNVPRHATATVDAVTPAITNVQASGVTTSSATVTWTTSEPSDTRVTYGTAPPGTQTVSSSQLVTSHSIGLTGLPQCTEHFFSVASRDFAGNVGTDDNSGAFHTFKTECISPPAVPDGSGSSDPLRAKRLLADGSRIAIYWDNSCSPAKVKVVYGPLSEVAQYTISGAICSIPPFVNPRVWNGIPPGDFWFLMIADDGFGTESSWGQSSTGERNGTTASGQCGTTQKDVTTSCP
jgi:hypothetical protein